MTMIAAAPSLGIGAALVLAALPASAFTCPASDPAVTVALAIPLPRIDNTLPLPALQKIASHEHAGRTLGLYQAEIEAHWTIHFSRRRQGEEACRWIESVAVTLAMPSRVIYVIRERQPGTCAYESVLAHERKHQATDDAVIEAYRSRLTAAAADAIRAAPSAPVAPADADAAERRLGTLVSKALQRSFDGLKRERGARQRAVDTPAEYRRVRAACG
jgi:hypothetical protein